MADTDKIVKPIDNTVIPQRIHFKQFIAMHPELDEMQVAGFRAYCGGKNWMYESEWEEKLKNAYGIENEKEGV